MPTLAHGDVTPRRSHPLSVHPTSPSDVEAVPLILSPASPPATSAGGAKERHHHHSLSGGTSAAAAASSADASSHLITRVDSKERWKDEWTGGGVLAPGVMGAGMGGSSKQRRRMLMLLTGNQALLSGMAYCASSCSMILLNKVVLSGYKWDAQIALMLYQNLVSVTLVLLLSAMGFITMEPLTLQLVAVWFPVNLIFVGMLVSSFFSLQYMQVAMVTILKNVTNLITAVGEMYLFRKRHSSKVWGALFLMIVSAFCGGFTDLAFHPVGYTWQLFNCLFTAGYSLTLRRVMDTAKSCTRSGQLSEFSMVLLNNSLSFPLAIVLMVAFGEVQYILNTPLMLDPGFWVASTLSGLLGLSISFTSMWFLHQTSPTTYSLVGSLNKIPLSILGIILFDAPTSVANVSSILFGCFAGVVFARAKVAG